jgi:Trp operon repressor
LAPVNKPKPLAHVLLEAMADGIAKVEGIPADKADAYRTNMVSVLQQICRDVLGCDSVQITGWVITPSEREARRYRILQALHAGEMPARIASRELVSVKHVERLRRTAAREHCPP